MVALNTAFTYTLLLGSLSGRCETRTTRANDAQNGSSSAPVARRSRSNFGAGVRDSGGPFGESQPTGSPVGPPVTLLINKGHHLRTSTHNWFHSSRCHPWCSLGWSMWVTTIDPKHFPTHITWDALVVPPLMDSTKQAVGQNRSLSMPS